MKSIWKICSLLVLTYNVFYAQSNYSKSIDINEEYNEGVGITSISDGYIVLSGSYCHNGTLECTDIIKVDSEGIILWQKQIDENLILNRPADGYANHGFAGEDIHHNLYFSGITYSPNTNFDYYVLKLTDNGDIVWFKTFGSNYVDNNCTLFFDNDSTLVLFGDRGTAMNGFDKIDFIKIDLDGNIVDQFTYGPANSFVERADVLKCENNDIVFSYVTCTEQNPCFFSNEKVLKLTRITDNGEVVWEKNIIEFDNIRSQNSIARLENGGFVLSYNTVDFNANYTYPPVLYWLDSLGNVEFTTEFDGTWERKIRDLSVTPEGNIIGCGYVDRLGKGIHGWVFSFDQNHSMLWNREILDYSSPFKIMQLNAIIPYEPSSILAVGFMLDSVLLNGTSFPDKDIWILKLDQNGCFYQNCDSSEIISSQSHLQLSEENIIVYPNPASDKIILEIDGPDFNPYKVNFYYLETGRLLFSKYLNNNGVLPLSVSTIHLPNGMYILEIFRDDKLIGYKKIMVIH